MKLCLDVIKAADEILLWVALKASEGHWGWKVRSKWLQALGAAAREFDADAAASVAWRQARQKYTFTRQLFPAGNVVAALCWEQNIKVH